MAIRRFKKVVNGKKVSQKVCNRGRVISDIYKDVKITHIGVGYTFSNRIAALKSLSLR